MKCSTCKKDLIHKEEEIEVEIPIKRKLRICVFGCGVFDDLIQHYEEKHNL